MTTIYLKLLAMLFPMALGYFLKKIHFFAVEDYRILAKIALNITLPAAIIVSFADFRMEFSLLGVVLTAFLADWAVLLFLYFSSWRQKNNPRNRSLQMLCGAGFNLGNFLIPLVQQFMGGAGVAVTALFDSGNSIMCSGGIYIFTTSVVKMEEEKTTLRQVLKKLCQPLMLTYVLMILMAVLSIPVPDFIVQIARPTGAANGFVSMLMIGVMFEIHFSPQYLRDAAVILSKKYFCAVCLALIFYYVLPFDLLVRQVIVLAAFAPIPSLASIFTGQSGGDTELASFVTSCSFVISCVVLSILTAVMGLA